VSLSFFSFFCLYSTLYTSDGKPSAEIVADDPQLNAGGSACYLRRRRHPSTRRAEHNCRHVYSNKA